MTIKKQYNPKIGEYVTVGKVVEASVSNYGGMPYIAFQPGCVGKVVSGSIKDIDARPNGSKSYRLVEFQHTVNQSEIIKFNCPDHSSLQKLPDHYTYLVRVYGHNLVEIVDFQTLSNN